MSASLHTSADLALLHGLSAKPNDGRWRAGTCVLCGLAITISFWGTIGQPNCQDLDFGAYYRAAVMAGRGETPYQLDEHGPMGVYSYAPAFAYLLIPLGYLDYLWACRLWLLVNWAATFAGFVLAFRLIRGPGIPSADRWRSFLLAALPTCAYLWMNLHMGQVATLMVLGCLGWAVCQRSGRCFRGGLLLAAATALKVSPGLLVPYLILRRDLRGLAGFFMGGLALLLMPAAWVGWEGAVHVHGEWVEHTLATQVPVQVYRPGNQSLLAELARLPWISSGHVCYSLESLATLSRLYPLVVLGLAAALHGWILWDRRAGGSVPAVDGCAAAAQRHRDNVHLAVLLVFITLAQPRGWRCNFVALLFPCALLVEHVRRRLSGFWVGLGALVLVIAACLCPTKGVGEQGWTLGAWLLLGKHFWAAVAVAGACWWCSLPARRPWPMRGKI